MIDRNSYPDGASLEEQRRAFALSMVNPNVRQNTEHAKGIEQFLAGPENAVDPAVAPFVSANTYPNDLPHNPFVTGSKEAEAWIGGYTRGIRWERDRRTDHEDQASYDRGWRNGSEAAVHIAESDAQKRGWNAALDELLGKRLSLDVLNKYIDTGAPRSSSVRNILLGMKKP